MAGRLKDDQYDKESEIEEETLLIPENVIDQASQRIFLVSIFVLIQCWKIYDILLIKADAFSAHMAMDSGSTAFQSFTSLNNFTFVLKYAVMDGLFLWTLPVLSVPLLRFLPLVTLLLTITVTCFTFVLASDTAIPVLSGAFVPIWNVIFRNKELTIVGDSINPQALSDMNAHFKGRYTIRYLPESSAQLNPFHFDGLCLEQATKEYSQFPSSIHLPIEFNTTSEIGMLRLQHTSPSNEVSYIDYTARDVKKLLRKDYSHLAHYPGFVSNDDRISYLEVNIKKPGTYKIAKVTDKEGTNIRSYKSEFSVAHCPVSKFIYPGLELAYSGAVCVGSHAQDLDWALPLVETYGVHPLQVQIAAEIEGKPVSQFNATIPVPSELEGAWTSTKSVKVTRNALEQEVLKQALQLANNAPGLVKFHLLAVTDYLGNTRRYNPLSTDKDVLHKIDIRRSPQILLIDKYPDRPLLENATKRLFLTLRSEISFPLHISMQFADDDGEGNSFTSTYTFNDLHELEKGIEISHPGEYVLREGSDKLCPCEIDKKPIQIRVPHPPEAFIVGKPITDKCVGDIGLQFDVKFSGLGPFRLLYQVFKNQSGTLRPVLSERGMAYHTKVSSEDNLRFDYKPEQEGSYTIVFKELRDKNYINSPISLEQAPNTFTIYSRQRSKLKFPQDLETQVIFLCKGEQSTIPISFDGNAPFSFSYEIVNKETKRTVKLEHVQAFSSKIFDIVTPKFDKGGEFEVKLSNVRDALDCPVQTVGRGKVDIRAQKNVPEVQIAYEESYEIVEGQGAEIQFAYKHASPSPVKKLQLSVQNLYKPDVVKDISISAADRIRVFEEGIYRLSSFKDERCPGIVRNSHLAVEVKFSPKPNLTFIADEALLMKQHSDGPRSIHLKAVCQNSALQVTPILEGAPPFFANHQITYPDGRSVSDVVPIPEQKITLPTDKEGDFELVFNGVYDKLYSKDVLDNLNYVQEPSTIRYSVLANPELKIPKGKLHIQICESMVQNEDAVQLLIPVDFKGQAPFTLSGVIRHTDTDRVERFEVKDIKSDEVDLRLATFKGKSLGDLLTVGDHLVIFESISDVNGCSNTRLHSRNTLSISVTKVPEITKESKKDYYCVGEHVSYKLQGIAPFQVYYNFNGQNRKAEVGHDFERLAAKSGELSIVALEDASVSRCLVNYTTIPTKFEDLKLQIHDIPSVEISHGDTIIKNLQEGDQAEIVFKFSGIPPFEVTYVRTIDESLGGKKSKSHKKTNKRRKVVDTKTIKDIWNYEHTEVVSLEGTYDAIEIKDAYCKAKRDVDELV